MKNWLIWILCFLPTFAFSNESVRGKWNVDGQDIYVGRQFYIELEVKVPSSVELNIPNDVPTIKGIEILGQSEVNKISESNATIYKKRFNFIAFDSLTALVPEISIPYIQDEKTQQIKIESVPFSIKRIPVDSTEVLRAAYGPIAPEESLNWNFFFIVIGILVVLAAVVALIQWKKGKSKLSIPLNADPKQWALEQLQILEDKVPFEQHSSSWVHLTEVLRLYMQRVWNIPAPYFSTGEILTSIAGKEAYSPLLEKVAQVLELGDQVKFAKEKTSQEQQIQAIQLSKEIVQYTYVMTTSEVKEEVLNE